jgi:hypothetical protein
MTDAPLTSPEAARWPWLRAIAFAVISSSIGVFGHALVMGDKPAYSVFVAAAVLMTLYARMFVTQRVGRAPMFLGVTVAQLLVHATMLLAAPTTMHGMQMDSSAHLASMRHGGPLIVMIVIHLAAILIGAGILLRLERSAWAHAKSVVEAIVAFAISVVRAVLEGIAHEPTPRIAVAVSQRTAVQRWIAASVGRRGPPAHAAQA